MKSRISFISVLLIFQLSHSQTFTGSGGSIPDWSTTCFEMAVANSNQMMNPTYGLKKVCITVNLGPSGAWAEDFLIYLQSPSGFGIYLSANDGPANQFNGTICFDMAAATPVSSWTATSGNPTHQPADVFGLFNNGQTSQGYWSLCFVDDILGYGGGTLSSWNLQFGSNPAGTPTYWHGFCANMDPALGPITYYDDGGPASTYGWLPPMAQTFSPVATGKCVQITLNTYDLESGWDYLDFYEGNQATCLACPEYIGSVTGSGTNVTVTSTTGSLTTYLDYDFSVFLAGWNATVTQVNCASGNPPATPSNDVCGSAIPLSGTGTNVNAKGCDIDAPNPHGSTCAWYSTENSVFYTVNVSATTTQPVTIDLLNVSCAGGGSALQMALFKNCDSVGVYGTNFKGCATGTGTVSLNAGTLPVGTYILAIDGDASANCTWNVQGSALAINWLEVEGRFDVNHRRVFLDWSVETATILKGFFVERSTNLQRWDQVAYVDEANKVMQYESGFQFIDSSFFNPGKYHYRIRYVDDNGKNHYSNIASIPVNAAFKEGIIGHYPNPAAESFTIELQVENESAANLELFSLDGRTIRNYDFGNSDAGRNFFHIVTTGCPPGMYAYKLDCGSRSWTGRIVIE